MIKDSEKLCKTKMIVVFLKFISHDEWAALYVYVLEDNGLLIFTFWIKILSYITWKCSFGECYSAFSVYFFLIFP